jgi:hypothetical protein
MSRCKLDRHRGRRRSNRSAELRLGSIPYASTNRPEPPEQTRGFPQDFLNLDKLLIHGRSCRRRYVNQRAWSFTPCGYCVYAT